MNHLVVDSKEPPSVLVYRPQVFPTSYSWPKSLTPKCMKDPRDIHFLYEGREGANREPYIEDYREDEIISENLVTLQSKEITGPLLQCTTITIFGRLEP